MHQKIVSLLMIVWFICFQFLSSPSSCLASPKNLPGDVDGDGRVTLEDARRIALTGPRIIESLPDPKIADVNGDGAITDGDALALAEKLTGQRELVAAFVEHSRKKQFTIGSIVTICVFSEEKETLKTGGAVRITSKKSGYDSGPQKFTLSGDGRYLFYHWPTSGLKRADDYEVQVIFNYVEDSKTKAISGPSQLRMKLVPFLAEKKILVTSRDLSLPSRMGKLYFERIFRHESSYYPYSGPLGYGWNHKFNLRLREYPDGMMVLFQSDQAESYFRSKPDGSYKSGTGDHRILRRLSDGSFELVEKDQTIWHFTPDFLLDQISNANGNKLTLSYDQNRLLASISDNAGQKFLFDYDPSGHIVQVTDHLGRKVSFKYDKVGNLNQHTDIAGHITKYEYDSEHRLSRIVYPDGSSQYYHYDENGQLASEERDQGFGAKYYKYDYETGEVTISDATGRGSRIRVNDLGQPIEISDCLGCPGGNWSMAYDQDFNLSQLTNPAGDVYQYFYNDRGNRSATVDPLGNTISASYHQEFNKITALIDDRENKIIFNYDDRGNRVETIYPDRSRETFKYDESGNLVSKTERAGQTIRYVYDNRGLLLKKIYPDETETIYGYDEYGNMTLNRNSVCTLEFQYDEMGRLVEAIYPDFGNKVITYTYDKMGRRTSMTYPNGHTIRYSYNSAGQITLITEDQGSLLVTFEYDNAGRRIRKTLGNGIVTAYEYDDYSRLESIYNKKSSGEVISYFIYEDDEIGNRISKTSKEGTENYSYDVLGQLTEVTYANGLHVVYTFDPAGNRTKVAENGRETDYSANSLNQYREVGNISLLYDANGNMISRSGPSDTVMLNYNYNSQLSKVSNSDGSFEFAYDALGRRISKSVNGQVREYLHDGVYLVSQITQSGTTIAQYFHNVALDEPLRMTRMGESYWYVLDGLGNVVQLTDLNGNVAESYFYDVYGIPTDASLYGNPFLFRSKEYDPNLRLYQLRFRYYDPWLGRFISPDPLANSMINQNSYTYAYNNPLTFTDPLGLQGSADWVRCVSELAQNWPMIFVCIPMLGTPAGWRCLLIVLPVAAPSCVGIVLEGGWEAMKKLLKKLRGGICPTFIQPVGDGRVICRLPELVSDSLFAQITIPMDGSLLRSDIPIFGVAGGTAFSSYRVEYGEDENPPNWYLIEESTIPQDSVPNFQDISWMQGDLDIRGNLATWNTGLKNWIHLPWHPPEDPTDLNGVYTVKLVVFGKNGETAEDRVTVEVGRVIAQCLPGIAVSTDKKVIMRFQEQSLMAPFRIYTIKPAGDDVPPIPEDQVLVSSVYQIREGGDWFIKPVTLEMEFPPEETDSNLLSSLGIFAYNYEGKEWQLVDTEFDRNQNLLRTQIYSLSEPKAYFAIMASKNGIRQSILVDSDMVASMKNLKLRQTKVSESVLVNDTFEDDIGEWSERDREAGAQVIRDNNATRDGSYCLRVENKNFGGNFASNVRTTPFEVRQFPLISFDYKVMPDVKIDFYAKVGGRWYDIGFTDDRNDYKNKDVNIEYVGQIPGIITDGEWHSASFNLYEMLQVATRKTQIERLIMADWDVGGYMKLEFGRNSRGAKFYIDNFSIFKDLNVSEPLPHPGQELWVEDFNRADGYNRLSGKRGLFSSPGITTCKSQIQTREGRDRIYGSGENVLAIDFDVSAAKNYGGFWTSLEDVSLAPSSELVFEVKGVPDVPPLLVGSKRSKGLEHKVPLQPYLQHSKTGTEFLEAHIPLKVFGGLGALNSMENLSFSFENELGSGIGKLLIDNIRFVSSSNAFNTLTIDDFEGPGNKYNYLGGEKWVFTSGEAIISSETVLDSVDDHDSKCLKILYGGAIGKDLGAEGFSYCGWSTSLRGLEVGKSDVLGFDIRGARGGEVPNVYLDDGNMRRPFLFRGRVDCTTHWQHIEIPLSVFAEQGIDISHLAEIQFIFEWDQMNGTVYIDNLQFKSSPSVDTQHTALPGDKK